MPKKGKSYHNFMEKKFYHPTSFRNLERVWQVKQEIADKDRKLKERNEQAKRENEEMETRILMGDKKAKMGIAFMYDPPAGMEIRDELDVRNGIHKELLGHGPHGTNKYAPDQVAQYKFDWQRNAPRSEYLNRAECVDMLNTIPTDKPFGIEVRNVMCIKCRIWGHCATDRDCPHYGIALKDIPERAADLAEKRKYLSAKYGESLGDDLDEDLIKMKEEEEIMRDKEKQNELKNYRRNGQVPDTNVRLRKHLRQNENNKYKVILSSDDDEWEEKKVKKESKKEAKTEVKDEVKSEYRDESRRVKKEVKEEAKSDSSSSSSSSDEFEFTAADREQILRRVAQLEARNFSGGKVKKEEKKKKEKKKKRKKEKKSKKSKKRKSDEWEEAPARKAYKPLPRQMPVNSYKSGYVSRPYRPMENNAEDEAFQRRRRQ